MGLGRIPHIVLNGAIIVNRDAAGESPILSKLGEVSEQISRLLDRENVDTTSTARTRLFLQRVSKRGRPGLLAFAGRASSSASKGRRIPGSVKTLGIRERRRLGFETRESKQRQPLRARKLADHSYFPPCYLSSLALNKNKGSAIRALLEWWISVQGIPSVSEILR